jgi:hypothetical protein
MNNTFQNHFSILGYYTDSTMHTNKHNCIDFTPPFLAYIPVGVNAKNVGLESDLKGITRLNSHCYKYKPKDIDLATQLNNMIRKTKTSTKECKPSYKILPNGYLPKFNLSILK